MQFTSAIAAAILATTASAAPLVARSDSGSFTLIATRSTSPVHLQSINANGLGFWVGKPTASYCPNADQSTCPPGNVTVFSTGGTGTVSPSVEVPGGQQIYISPEGNLAFTQAHSANVPAGSVRTGFQYTAPTEPGRVGNLAIDGGSFYACPVTQDDGTTDYQIRSDVTGCDLSSCLGINLAATPYDQTPAAWQYT